MNKLLLEKILAQPSFYPGQPRKSLEVRRKDLIDWYEKYNEINEYYNVWGGDLTGSDLSNYLDHGVFRKQRYKINSEFLCSGDRLTTNYTALMRDKSAFEMFVSNVLNDTAKYVLSYGWIKGFTFYSHEGDYSARKNDTLEKLLERHNGEKIVIKRATGCSGKGVFVACIHDGKLIRGNDCVTPSVFLEKICDPASTWMLQPFVKQTEFMSSLNANTVNIVRIVTFNTGKRVFYVPPMLVYSRGDTEVCNSDQGSYYVGISMRGIIETKAIDQIGCQFIDCPVGGKKLPFFTEMTELVTNLHSAIPELFTIGWDVAFTDSGPLVFEGNDGWCPYVSQWSEETALRKIWNQAVNERKEHFGL